MRQLRAELGTDPSQWHWGRVHQAHFDHPLASVTPLNLIFSVAPLERLGDSVTVNIGGTMASPLIRPTMTRVSSHPCARLSISPISIIHFGSSLLANRVSLSLLITVILFLSGIGININIWISRRGPRIGQPKNY
jgi:hypothetical protein